MSLTERWTQTLNELQTQGRLRSLKLPSGIDFTSNDYLGYATRVRKIEPQSELSRSGIASRLLRGHHELWDRVESELAAWHGAESVLMMTSGFSANEGLISTVVEPGDWVATDAFSLADITAGVALDFAGWVKVDVNEGRPALAAWRARLAQRPSFAL